MTKEELAKMLNGRQYRNETAPQIEQLAEENNLLIVFGYSDDVCEFRGAINDEFDCFDGGEIKCWRLPKPIEAVWCPSDYDCSWAYKTELPHAKFKIYEGDELYCIGIVIDLNETEEIKTIPSPEEVVERMLKASQIDNMEDCHIEMDKVMLETLAALGYGKTAEIFTRTDKCYI